MASFKNAVSLLPKYMKYDSGANVYAHATYGISEALKD
jgi:hypothetical protein